MSFCERPAGAAFQVPLESRGGRVIRELHGEHYLPRSISCRVNVPTCVVPSQSLSDVGRQADIMALGIQFASKNVDEPSDSHQKMSAQIVRHVCGRDAQIARRMVRLRRSAASARQPSRVLDGGLTWLGRRPSLAGARRRRAKAGGEGGIRTHVSVTRQDAFEAPPLRPLRYLSV